MSKHGKQGWPTWKIVSIAIVCAAIGTALLVSLAYIPAAPATSQPAPGKAPSGAPDPTQPYSNLGLSSIVILLGLMAWGLALVMVGWLGYRMYMRIPAWRRRRWFGGR